MKNKETSLPAPPTSSNVSPLSVRALFVWHDVRGRGPFSVRAALCMALPATIGWLLGYEIEGLIATLGGFAGLYGAQQAYHRRALILAWAVVGLTIAVALGSLGAVTTWFGVLTVALFAGVTVWICNSLNVGSPGAYMFVLACTMGVMIHGKATPLWQTLLLVAGGGIIAWCVQMTGYLIYPNGPQRRIVIAAARAVRSLVHSLGTPGEEAARYLAASSLQTSLEMLKGTPLETPYQKLNRRINRLFAAVNRRDSASDALLALSNALVEEAGRLPTRRVSVTARSVGDIQEVNRTVQGWRASELIMDGFFRRYSEVRRCTIRVIIASALSGALALTLGMNQAFWAITTAVLVLHQSAGRKILLQRGWLRLMGTLLGLLLAEILILINPHGLWLVLTIGIMQFIVEMLILRNYALAAAFVTPGSLLIAVNVIGSPDNLLFARGVDTLLGVLVAYFVLFIVFARSGERQLPEILSETLDASEASLNMLATGDVGSEELLRRQARLRHRLIDLYDTYNNAIHESRETEKMVVPYWNNVVRTLRVGYQILVAGWSEGANLNLTHWCEQIKIERGRCKNMAVAMSSQGTQNNRKNVDASD
ncbi:MAG: FUSC family protein [Burkholderiales bacterium]|nr:FUSC family protein [Burkholderiales bacterium]